MSGQLEVTSNPTENSQAVTVNTNQEAPQSQEPNNQQAQTQEQTLQSQIQENAQVEQELTNHLKNHGVNFDDITDEYQRLGRLTDDTVKKLETAGYPKIVIENYLKGTERVANEYANQVYQFVGGKEAYGQLAEFVRSLGDGHVEGFNHVVNQGNLQAVQMMINGYKVEMEKQYGTQNRTVLGGVQSPQGVQGFQSKGEMIQAMSDPRYETDANYRREVEQKVIKSSIFN